MSSSSPSTGPLALVVLIRPTSRANRDKFLALHTSYVPFFRSKQPTRTIFTPTTRPKAQLGMVGPNEADTLLGLVEIWDSNAALKAAVKVKDYQTFFGKVGKEGLFDQKTGMQISQWSPSAGFVARQGAESPKAGIVMLAKFVVKGEGEDLARNRAGLVDVIGNFCNWIEKNEAGTLTYAVFTSNENPAEVLLFERYKDAAALGVHGKTAEFKAMFRGTGKFIQGRKTVLSEWVEEDGSFVRRVDVGESAAKAKL